MSDRSAGRGAKRRWERNDAFGEGSSNSNLPEEEIQRQASQRPRGHLPPVYGNGVSPASLGGPPMTSRPWLQGAARGPYLSTGRFPNQHPLVSAHSLQQMHRPPYAPANPMHPLYPSTSSRLPPYTPANPMFPPFAPVHSSAGNYAQQPQQMLQAHARSQELARQQRVPPHQTLGVDKRTAEAARERLRERTRKVVRKARPLLGAKRGPESSSFPLPQVKPASSDISFAVMLDGYKSIWRKLQERAASRFTDAVERFLFVRDRFSDAIHNDTVQLHGEPKASVEEDNKSELVDEKKDTNPSLPSSN